MDGASRERARLHQGGQTTVTVSRYGARRTIAVHLARRALLIRRAAVTSGRMIRIHAFQAGVALATLRRGTNGSERRETKAGDLRQRVTQYFNSPILPDSSCVTCSFSCAASYFAPRGRRGKSSTAPVTWTLSY